MRQYAFVACTALLASAATIALAQPRHPTPRAPPDGGVDAAAPDVAPRPGSPNDSGADANVDARTDARVDTRVDTSTDLRADARTNSVGDAPPADAISSDARYPMHQTGAGTVIHFPIPEQLVRTAVPVFAQIRSSAPIDHVSLFYRSVGARRYTELRLTAMGQQFHLPSGYGAQIPCEDVFPPRVEYYVQAIDQSNTPNGTAGSEAAPIAIPVVETRSHPAPTLPGQPPPPTCGSLTVGVTVRDAGAVTHVPERGTNDLGEPCRSDNDCRRGLRCSTSSHTCIFENTR